MPTSQSGFHGFAPDPTRRDCRLPGKPGLHAFERLEIRHRSLAASLAFLVNVLKRLGGNENRFGSPLL